MQRLDWTDGSGLETQGLSGATLMGWGQGEGIPGAGQGQGLGILGRVSWGGAGLTKLLDGTVSTPRQLKCHVDPAPLVLDPTISLERDSRAGSL